MPDPEPVPSVRVPADVQAPDKLIYDLTARQVAVLAVAGACCYLLWQAVGGRVPLPVFFACAAPVLALGTAMALGRRDGLSLDRWLWAAVRFRVAARRHVAAVPPPAVGSVGAGRGQAGRRGRSGGAALEGAAAVTDAPAGLQVLHLPARGITADGVIDLADGRTAAMVAAGTINVGLRTGAEQQGLLDGYARWLNALTGAVQVTVSARRVDLASHARRIQGRAASVPADGTGGGGAALAAAAADYAAFLLDLADRRDPLARQITITCTGDGAPARNGTGRPGSRAVAAAEVRRRAERTAAAFTALGAHTRVLDGRAAAAVLAGAADPYAVTDVSWSRALPQDVITGGAAVTR